MYINCFDISVNITCIVRSLKKPEHIFWYHDGQVISYYSARGGVSVVREEEAGSTESRSTLVIRDPGDHDQERIVNIGSLILSSALN